MIGGYLGTSWQGTNLVVFWSVRLHSIVIAIHTASAEEARERRHSCLPQPQVSNHMARARTHLR
jgi:hypothetical protein